MITLLDSTFRASRTNMTSLSVNCSYVIDTKRTLAKIARACLPFSKAQLSEQQGFRGAEKLWHHLASFRLEAKVNLIILAGYPRSWLPKRQRHKIPVPSHYPRWGHRASLVLFTGPIFQTCANSLGMSRESPPFAAA